MPYPPDTGLVADIVRYHARKRPDHPALKQNDQILTYAQLDRDSSSIAHALNRHGVSRGDRVAWLGKNSIAYFQFLFGAAKAGVCLVVLNWRLVGTEVEKLIRDAEPGLVFVESEFAENVPGLDIEGRQVIVVDEPVNDSNAFTSWWAGSPEKDYQAEIETAMPFLQMYTSGTTGMPKGAVLSHGNVTACLKATPCERHGIWVDEDKVLVAMPCFHVSGTVWALLAFFAGATAVVMSAVDIGEIIKKSREEEITQALFVPTVIQMILGSPEFDRQAFSSMKNIYYGAAPMPMPLLKQAMNSFSCGFREVYGATELTGAVVMMSDEEHVRAASTENKLLRSCGKPLDKVQLKIVGLDGEKLPANNVGELRIKCPSVMLGYWRRPEETDRAIQDGWYNTGDVGYFDEEGFLFISDRIKDMIISGGENIYPAEIESVLSAHPAVLEAAVIGIPNDKWGEEVKAIVVLRESVNIDGEEIIEHCANELAGYKVPASVDFIERLPRNPSGKILKAALRKPYWEGADVKI